MAKIDLSGQTIGKWFVLPDSCHQRGNNTYLLCRCKCGLEKPVLAINLRREESLGCKNCKDSQLIDLTGQEFGSWTVLRFHSTRTGGSNYWLCRCECGREKPIRSNVLRTDQSLACSRCRIKYLRRKRINYCGLELMIWVRDKDHTILPPQANFPLTWRGDYELLDHLESLPSLPKRLRKHIENVEVYRRPRIQEGLTRVILKHYLWRKHERKMRRNSIEAA